MSFRAPEHGIDEPVGVITNLREFENRLVPFRTDEGQLVGEVGEFPVHNVGGVTVSCGVWRTGPIDWVSSMRGPETLLVLSGGATVHIDDRRPVQVAEGSVVNVARGAEIRIVVDSELTAFFTLMLR